MELASGREIGGWRVEAEVGRGAMASVYRVRHVVLGTCAALKVLDRVDAITEQRLLREGRAQGSVGHPGVVAVLDHLRVDGHAALLLEHVDGGDLATVLREGLELPEALDLFRQVVEAVGAAHRAGLVHRDLKPSNILVSTSGPGGRRVAKVGDFGLVKTIDADLTATHAMVGTPRYMAPEQMRAAGLVDARADVFALGAVLYELACGRQAFEGDDLVLLYTHKASERYASPETLAPELPRPVIEAIEGCLKSQPARRIPSCEVLLAVLDGEPWRPPAADETLDDAGIAICPACGVPASADLCGACGASTTLGGRYRLVESRSEGERTHVWRALDLKDGRWATARSLAPGGDPLARQRFERGARVAAELDHPQIARGLCAPFSEHGRLWEVRAFVEGRSLDEVLAARRLSEDEVLDVLQQLCAPLRYLAQRSPPVVHRALLPSNVLRTGEGALVLVDFAQCRDGIADGSLHDVPEGAPEQWAGEATPASDVFGLGALAITLLTRKPAHTLPRRVLPAGLPVRTRTRALLLRMLADDPKRRPSIDEIEREVMALRSARQPPDIRFRWGVAGLFASVGLLSAVLAVSATLPPILRAFGDLLESVRSHAERSEATPAWPANPPSPQRILTPGADLAERLPPGANCGPVRDVTVTAPHGTGIQPLYARTCDGEVHDLGLFSPGESKVVALPGEATFHLPFHSVDLAADSGNVYLRSERVPFLAERRPLERGTIYPARARWWSVDPEGKPMLERLQQQDEPWLPSSAALALDADGLAQMSNPWVRVALSVDGVFRPLDHPPDGIHVAPVRSVSRMRVTTPDDAPIADAEVFCFPDRERDLPDPGQILAARTDGKGQVVCGSSGEPYRWALVDAPGRVTQVTELVEGEVRVVLPEARTIRVGCASPAGDTCEQMARPPVCAGSRERSSGTCRLDADALVCDCAADADRIEHGIFGTVPLSPGLDRAWFDLRSLDGVVTGRIDGSIVPCGVELVTPYGALSTQAERSGAFVFRSVPDGGYLVRGSCGSPLFDIGTAIVSRDTPHVVLLPVQASPSLRLPSRAERLAAGFVRDEPEDIERELLDYAFPPWPEEGGERERSLACTARITIGADGRASAVEVSRCPEPFVRAAETAVRSWRWATADAESIESLLVPFDIDRH